MDSNMMKSIFICKVQPATGWSSTRYCLGKALSIYWLRWTWAVRNYFHLCDCVYQTVRQATFHPNSKLVQCIFPVGTAGTSCAFLGCTHATAPCLDLRLRDSIFLHISHSILLWLLKEFLLQLWVCRLSPMQAHRARPESIQRQHVLTQVPTDHSPLLL